MSEPSSLHSRGGRRGPSRPAPHDIGSDLSGRGRRPAVPQSLGGIDRETALASRGKAPSRGQIRAHNTINLRQKKVSTTYQITRVRDMATEQQNAEQLNDTDFESEEPVHATPTPSVILSPPSAMNRDNIHPKWYLRAIMYMVAFLHTRHRVTFAASGVILLCLGFIFSSLSGNLTGGFTVPHTLQTVFS
ncbi:hypothetical protein C8R44DRAFT_858609 [Mycena epipterygia]|nr:hypothetical protein C8R44DRAFT_858609 [Mycena epipterygia]